MEVKKLPRLFTWAEFGGWQDVTALICSQHDWCVYFGHFPNWCETVVWLIPSCDKLMRSQHVHAWIMLCCDAFIYWVDVLDLSVDAFAMWLHCIAFLTDGIANCWWCVHLVCWCDQIACWCVRRWWILVHFRWLIGRSGDCALGELHFVKLGVIFRGRPGQTILTNEFLDKLNVFWKEFFR